MEMWRVLQGENMKMEMWRILQGGNMNMIYTAILAALLCAFFLKRKASLKGTPPGSLGWPLLGETMEFLAQQRKGNPQEFVKSRAAKYGNVFKTSLIGNPTVVFGGAEGNRFLFSNENKLVELYWPKSVRDIFNNSMLNTVGEEAKRIRKILMTFLGPEALQNFVGITDSMAKSHLAMHWKAKEQVTVHPLVKKFTFSLFCNTFLSITNEKDVEELLLPFDTLTAGILQLPLNAYWTGYSTQMSETYFENAESFDPDRYGDEGAVPYTLVPFGGGARICPGGDFGRMEMLVFMHHLVNRFTWELVDADEKIVVNPMPMPTKGLPIKLIPRTSS